MSTIEAGVNFWIKIDTDNDLFGKTNGFLCEYILDNTDIIIKVPGLATEIIRPITSAHTATVDGGGSDIRSGTKIIDIDSGHNIVQGDVISDGDDLATTIRLCGTSGMDIITENGNYNSTNISFENDTSLSGDTAVEIDEFGTELVIRIDDGVTLASNIEIALEGISWITSVTDNSGGGAVTISSFGDSLNSSIIQVAGKDASIHYVTKINPTSIKIATRTKMDITDNITLIQVGNTGIYRFPINISTIGNYTVIMSNLKIDMQNTVFPVNIIDPNKKYFRGFV